MISALRQPPLHPLLGAAKSQDRDRGRESTTDDVEYDVLASLTPYRWPKAAHELTKFAKSGPINKIIYPTPCPPFPSPAPP